MEYFWFNFPNYVYFLEIFPDVYPDNTFLEGNFFVISWEKYE